MVKINKLPTHTYAFLHTQRYASTRTKRSNKASKMAVVISVQIINDDNITYRMGSL